MAVAQGLDSKGDWHGVRAESGGLKPGKWTQTWPKCPWTGDQDVGLAPATAAA